VITREANKDQVQEIRAAFQENLKRRLWASRADSSYPLNLTAHAATLGRRVRFIKYWTKPAGCSPVWQRLQGVGPFFINFQAWTNP